ncbi:hypothetical protein RB595_004912 [Gaeumannomyces hyphopodioides]
MLTTVANRGKLACASCTRRKVKCSKTTPCANCVRRGEQNSCGPSPGPGHFPSPDLGLGAAEPATPPTTASPTHGTGRRGSWSTTDARSAHGARRRELEMLRSRIAELEGQEEAQQVHQRRPPSSSGSPRIGKVQSEGAAGEDGRGRSEPDTYMTPTPSEREAVTRGPYNGEAESSAGSNRHTALEKDAASILEFLAWGRRKDPDYPSAVSLSPEAVADTVVSADGQAGTLSDAGPDAEDPREESSSSSLLEQGASSLDVIRLLLPSQRLVWQLVGYHDECLLWYHGSYFAPSFRAQLRVFYARHGGAVDGPGLNLQWVALLLAIMTASLVCAPPGRVCAWGFGDRERDTLSRRWFQASVDCLNRAQYTANLSILSCQAIATSTTSAHMLGFSNTQSIHLAAAVRIAQSLGLHRLGPDVVSSSPVGGAGRVEAEIGRRVWCQLCSQDWFGIPFSESYLVNPAYSTSEPPSNCHDDDLVPLPEHVPTISSYCRFVREIAAIMPRLQDSLVACNTAYTRYEQVRAWDMRLRRLATAERPLFLSHVPPNPGWPAWTPWARRALAISSGHKIIMIHRSFLSESFTNPAFAFTRRTCLAASKTIIKEYREVVEEDGPILWIHQAFSVAACIILVLDILHRDPDEPECVEHRRLVEDALDILRLYRHSMIASRGIKIVSVLLGEISRQGCDDSSCFPAAAAATAAATTTPTAPASTNDAKNKTGTNMRKRPRHHDDGPWSHPRRSRRRRDFDVKQFVERFCGGEYAAEQQQQPQSAQHQRQPQAQQWQQEQSHHHRPPRSGLETARVAPLHHAQGASPWLGTSAAQPEGDQGDQQVQPRPGPGNLADALYSDTNFAFPALELDGSSGFENLLYLASHDY